MTDALLQLADEIRACRACPLWKTAKQAVPGEGSGESGIFFLGEGPGFNEDQQGRPFVGAAGDLAKGELAAEEPDSLIGELIGDALAFDGGLHHLEVLLGHAARAKAEFARACGLKQALCRFSSTAH